MSKFAAAVANQKTTTTNGMKARRNTANACVDLFFKIGASRGKNIIPEFTAAYAEDSELALRIVAWARDVRGGAGERELFRQVLKHLEKTNKADAVRLLNKVPVVGRWDDAFSFEADLKTVGFNLVAQAIADNNQLAAKWTPRKGKLAAEFRNYLGWTPKFYRKRLVELTNVVETQMCAKDWDNINFSHVPSVAAARYKKAFQRNTPMYAAYVDQLVKGTDPTVKVNANAVYPYDVIKGVNVWLYSQTELDLITKQWEALPNYIGDAKILPMVDVSGSMVCPAGGNPNLTCLDVAVSLGLYCADKNVGAFKDLFLTFSSNTELVQLKGNIVQKINQMRNSDWGMTTNLESAFEKILEVATSNKVPQTEMPATVVIFSDMQFNRSTQRVERNGRVTEFNRSAMEMIRQEYKKAGYIAPQVVFWNLNAHDNAPVKFDESGVALVSGFSPAVMTAVLANDGDGFTPESIMLTAVMNERYDL